MSSLFAAIRGVVLIAGLAAPVLPHGGCAQSLDLTHAGDGPIEVKAAGGIEWRREDRTIRASDEATAAWSGVTVRADRLIARYRENAANGDGLRIYRLEALGAVAISSPTGAARGDKAVCNVDTGVITITSAGQTPASLRTSRGTVVANDAIIYDSAKLRARAVGGAAARMAERTLTAQTIVAYMEKVGARTELSHLEALGGVVIAAKSETARGSRGDYDAKTGIATLTGSVTVTHGETTLTGTKAVVNMKTGVSRLLGGAHSRVKAVLTPRKKTGAATKPR